MLSARVHMPRWPWKPCACQHKILLIHHTRSVLLPLLLLLTALTPYGRSWLYRLSSGDLICVALAPREQVPQVSGR